MKIDDLEHSEELSVLIRNFVQKCKEHGCMENLLGTFNSDKFLVHSVGRGNRDEKESNDVAYMPIKERKTSTDTPMFIHNLYNSVQQKRYGMSFRTGLFTYPQPMKYIIDGSVYEYLIIPTDDCKLGFSNASDPFDFFIRLSDENVLFLRQAIDELQIHATGEELEKTNTHSMISNYNLLSSPYRTMETPLPTLEANFKKEFSDSLWKIFKEYYVDALLDFVRNDAIDIKIESTVEDMLFDITSESRTKGEVIIKGKGVVGLNLYKIIEIGRTDMKAQSAEFILSLIKKEINRVK